MGILKTIAEAKEKFKQSLPSNKATQYIAESGQEVGAALSKTKENISQKISNTSATIKTNLEKGKERKLERLEYQAKVAKLEKQIAKNKQPSALEKFATNINKIGEPPRRQAKGKRQGQPGNIFGGGGPFG